jgi:hypothetical protein
MTERLVDAEKGTAEADRGAAIAQAALALVPKHDSQLCKSSTFEN